MISFDITPEEQSLVMAITERAITTGLIQKTDRIRSDMDLAACHANGQPLALELLLHSNIADFCHDVGGISRHIDRKTGEITGGFTARFAKENHDD